MDCINCKHCGPIVFSSSHHRECHAITDALDRVLMAGAIATMDGQVPFVVEFPDGREEPLMTINQHGFKHNWANWPLNFDPIWIEDCKLFIQKTDKNGKDSTIK